MNRIFLYFILLLLCSSTFSVHAQSVKNAFITSMAQREDSMKNFAFSIVNAKEAAERFRADSNFTKMFVRALKEPYSFNYPFDSLQTISRLYAPDSSFRIITWQVVKDESVFRRHGAIQMKTRDGSLLLFPLVDKTSMAEDINNIVTTNENWIGAIYYHILQNTSNGKKYYTLFGYDENGLRSTKKRIEVLYFNQEGKPVFGGGRFFSFEKDITRKPDQSRFSIEYKKQGNASIRYDETLGMIIYDHLISEDNLPEKKYTYVPDGDYEGFKWENGRWVHIDKVFTFKLQEGQAPVEKPIKENKLDLKNPNNN
ncbi:MAG: hypothetical protein QM802_21740 [Agriterribacter sp.]